jgi:hypothetical protein
MQHVVSWCNNEKGGEAYVVSKRHTKKEEDKEENEEIELLMPGWFEFKNYNTSATHVGTIN